MKVPKIIATIDRFLMGEDKRNCQRVIAINGLHGHAGWEAVYLFSISATEEVIKKKLRNNEYRFDIKSITKEINKEAPPIGMCRRVELKTTRHYD